MRVGLLGLQWSVIMVLSEVGGWGWGGVVGLVVCEEDEMG